jgi:hypothetical protein
VDCFQVDNAHFVIDAEIPASPTSPELLRQEQLDEQQRVKLPSTEKKKHRRKFKIKKKSEDTSNLKKELNLVNTSKSG